MNDGIHPDLSMSDYRALDRYGSSDLKAMRLGPPARVVWDRENGRPDTTATVRGTAAHALILTPALFAATYVEKPVGMEYRSAENKAWRDAHEQAGRVILPQDEWGKVNDIATAFQHKRVALDSLQGATGIETSILWTCPTTGLALKGRADYYQDEYVFDLKITRDAGPRLAFKAYINGWLHQLAHYRDGLNACGVPVRTGRIVAVNPDPPHFIWCVEARVSDLDVLALENETTRKAMAECIAAGRWPDTPDCFDKIDIPQYALQDVVATAEALEVDGE